jgi:hypothetical protein
MDLLDEQSRLESFGLKCRTYHPEGAQLALSRSRFDKGLGLVRLGVLHCGMSCTPLFVLFLDVQ